MLRHATLTCLAIAVIAGSATAALAQGGFGHAVLTPDPGFWTPEALAAVRPLPLPRAGAAPAGAAVEEEPIGAEVPELTPASQPSLDVEPDWSLRIGVPATPAITVDGQPASAAPRDEGRARLLFSSSRVFPADALAAYPYRTTGILIFKDGSGEFQCTASMIQRRLLLTAGHCVYDAATKTFNSNFMFLPAADQGKAPFGAWPATEAFVTSTWMTGKAVVPNAADYGILVIKDQPFDGGPLQALGNVVGWLGTLTSSLFPNHVTMLGYPANLDNAVRMHRVDSQSDLTPSSNRRTNTVLYGSDMQHGSSGGPWVQNFGVFSVGQTLNAPGNVVVAVTSFGPDDTTQEDLGASVPDSRLTAMVKAACAAASGNCQ